MSYIDESLGRNERLHYRARFPAFHYVAGWSLLCALLIAAAAAMQHGFGWLALVLALVGTGLFVAVMLPMWTTEIGVTTQRLVFKRGLLWRTTKELQLRAIEEVNLEQGLLGRLFNFGRIELHGTGVDDIRLPPLANPIAFHRAIQEAIGAAAQNSGAALPLSPVSPQGLVAPSTVTR